MSIITFVIAAITGGLIGAGAVHLWLRLTPLFKPGTPVTFYGGECTGIYVRHAACGYHRVKATGPDWYSAAREGREVVATTEELRAIA